MQDDRLERVILVVNHHADQIATVRQVLDAKADQYHLRVIDSEAAALAWLKSSEVSKPSHRPNLILLNLDFPCQNSLAMLMALKGDANLRRIPVIVISESGQMDTVFQSYFHQGNCYVTNSADMQQLATIIQQIESFWLEIVTLPS
jgi:chemotaxis family two-component system response regulator Rcp1